jgi:hypothetical protein
MMGLADPGMRIWLEPNDDPRKKLKFGWRLVELPGGHWSGIDTGRAEPGGEGGVARPGGGGARRLRHGPGRGEIRHEQAGSISC